LIEPNFYGSILMTVFKVKMAMLAAGALVALNAMAQAPAVKIGVAEIHEMKMEGDVMRMRAIAALDLPAGKSVALRPGGYHLMLMDLKQPLVKDTQVPVTLRFADAQGKTSEMQLSLPIALTAPAGAPKAAAGHGAHKHH
jgi:copper(I)-binding protein